MIKELEFKIDNNNYLYFKCQECIFDRSLIMVNNKLFVDIHWTIDHGNNINSQNLFIEKNNLVNHLSNKTKHKVWSNKNIFKMINMELDSVKPFGYGNESFEQAGGLINKYIENVNLNLYHPHFIRILNYWHFCFQELPKLYMYFELKKKNPDLKIVFNIDQVTSWHKELFKILKISEKDIFQIKNNYKIKNEGNTYIPMFYQKNNILDWTREFYITKIQTPIYKSLDIKYKLCFLRKETNSRGIINYNEIFDIVKNYGYISFDNSESSLAESINMFSNCSEIIIDNGAGAFNLIYCNDNVKAILINGPHASKYIKNGTGYFQAAKHIKNINIIKKESENSNDDWEFDDLMISKLKNILNSY